MFEQARQHYLKQMGVTLWYSRCELPGAAMSPEFLFGANLDSGDGRGGGVLGFNADPSNKDSVSESIPVAPRSAADILNVLSATGVDTTPTDVSQGLVDESTVNVLPDPQNIVTSISAEVFDKSKRSNVPLADASQQVELTGITLPVDVEALDLMLYVGQKSWFLSDNDSEFPGQLRRQLLMNIAAALGEDVEPVRVVCFKWPFLGNQRLPGNDAKSMLTLLREWLSGHVEGDSLSGFLMGHNVSRLLLQKSASEHSGAEFEFNISDEREVKVVVTLSLNDLLRDPLNKRIAWQHMSSCRIK